MEELIQVLFFVAIFVIGPILEAKKRKNQQKNLPRPQPRSGQVPSRTEPADFRTPAPVDLRSPAPQSSTPSEERSAATMVPEDLWAVLTGQAPLPKPAPSQTPDTWHEEEDDEEFAAVEEATYESDVDPWRPKREEAVSLEREPNRAPTYVVSMETLPLPPRERHAAFHEKIAAPLQAEPQPARKRQIGGVGLRQAFVIQTVLGKPKALE